jgi:hypothetical protein
MAYDQISALARYISGNLLHESDTKIYDLMRYRHIDKDAIGYDHVTES